MTGFFLYRSTNPRQTQNHPSMILRFKHVSTTTYKFKQYEHHFFNRQQNHYAR